MSKGMVRLVSPSISFPAHSDQDASAGSGGSGPRKERRVCLVLLRATGAGQEACNQDRRSTPALRMLELAGWM